MPQGQSTTAEEVEAVSKTMTLDLSMDDFAAQREELKLALLQHVRAIEQFDQELTYQLEMWEEEDSNGGVVEEKPKSVPASPFRPDTSGDAELAQRIQDGLED